MGGLNLYLFVLNCPIIGWDNLGLCNCVVKDPLKIRLTPPKDIVGARSAAEPKDKAIWDGDQATIWFTMQAAFNCSRCCEFRQEVKGYMKVNGTYTTPPRGYADPTPYFRDDGYNTEQGKEVGAYSECKDGWIMFKDFDYPGIQNLVGANERVDVMLQFRGFIVDICNGNRQVGNSKYYSFRADGTTPNVKIRPLGFDD